MNKPELFLLSLENDRYLLYAPLRRAAAVINRQAAGVVGAYLQNPAQDFNEKQKEIIDRLVHQELIGGEEPSYPIFPDGYGFTPYEVTLFLTSRCNLRCLYCYANGGEVADDLTWEESKAAIDFVVANALAAQREDFLIGFHGGGEPTLAWDLMKRCTEYALQQGADHNLNAVIHTATNGILNDEQRQYLMSHFSGVNVSFDGPADIQNLNRPFCNGSPSFDQVWETLKCFDEHDFHYAIRVTVTEESAGRMAEIVRFLGENLYALDQIHIEPLWYCGRCRTSGMNAPQPQSFIKGYNEAIEAARELQIDLKYSGARLDSITNKFCAAPGEGFSVAPGGIVTSCYEVLRADDPRAGLFHYGKFDPQSGIYKIDTQKIERLRKLSVENLAFCEDCFCKWHCAGDCISKALKSPSPEGHEGSSRCEINRQLTLMQIMDVIGIQNE